jgi:hypothetical protein
MNQSSNGGQQGLPAVVKLVLGMVGAVVLLIVALNVWAFNNAGEYRIVQYPNGHLRVITTAGPYVKCFGDVKSYRQVVTLEFGSALGGNEHKSAQIEPVPVMFNDAASAKQSGLVRVNLPSSPVQLLKIRNQYSGGFEHFVSNGIIPVVTNAVRLSANLRSSQEAYMALAPYQSQIEDQLMYGTYQTKSVEKWVRKATGDSERVKTTEIVLDSNKNPVRQPTILEELGCSVTQCQIAIPDFDSLVLKMIQQRKDQALQTEVMKQEAIRATQAALTAEQNGKANTMKAKWEQEAIKATAVTIAEKMRDSAKLGMEAAGYEKQASILRGEGESTYRRMLLNADGALSIKGPWIVEINRVWADAFSKFGGSVVPQTVFGTGAGTGGNAFTDYMQIMTAQAAKQFNVDMSVPRGATTSK